MVVCPVGYIGNCTVCCQKGLDIKIHNSVNNRPRDLWSFAFESSLLGLSKSIILKSLNSFKLFLPGNLDAPFLAQMVTSLDQATFERMISILVEMF